VASRAASRERDTNSLPLSLCFLQLGFFFSEIDASYFVSYLPAALSSSCFRLESLGVAVLLLLGGCDGGGPEACEGDLPAVERGAFAVEVRAGGDCWLYRGEAFFSPDERDPDSFGRAFVVELRAEGDENAPVFYLTHPGTELSAGTYDVSDLSSVNRLEVREGKVSVGGSGVYSRLDAFSIGEKVVEVDVSKDERFVASFDATVKLRDNVDLPDGPDTARLRGRLKARFSERVVYPGY